MSLEIIKEKLYRLVLDRTSFHLVINKIFRDEIQSYLKHSLVNTNILYVYVEVCFWI